MLNNVYCHFQLAGSHWNVLACPQAKIRQSEDIYNFKQCPALSAPETVFSAALHSVFCSFLLEVEKEKWAGVLKATGGTYVSTCR